MVTEGTKEQMILAIQSLNRSATTEFLKQFAETDLREYLASLRGNVRQGRSESTAAREQEVVGVG